MRTKHASVSVCIHQDVMSEQGKSLSEDMDRWTGCIMVGVIVCEYVSV